MSTTGHSRSRMFKVSASLLLSTAYFVAAIGVWMIAQGDLDTTADISGVACTPAFQATDTFNNGGVGSSIALPTGWQFDTGSTQIGIVDRNISRVQQDDAWAAAFGRIQRSTRQARQGEMMFKLALASPSVFGQFNGNVTSSQFDISLPTQSGSPLALRYTGTATTGGLQYRDPLSGEYRPLEYREGSAPFGVPTAGMEPITTRGLGDQATGYDVSFTVRWDGTSFTVEAPSLAADSGGALSGFSKTYRYAQNDATSITGVTVSNVLVQQITYPAGDSVPCLTAITPATAAPGATVTLTGSQFESSGMKVLLTNNGVTRTVDSGISVTGTTSLTFTVPTDLAEGSYTVKVSNAAGTSNQSQTLLVGPGTGGISTGPGTLSLVCAEGDPVKASTDTFDAFADGATDFGWVQQNGPNTSSTIRTYAGKSGNGIQMSDSNGGEGYAHQALLQRAFRPSASGEVSFDLRPHQRTGRLSAVISNKPQTGQSDAGFFYFSPSGTYEYWSYAPNTGYLRIGSGTYEANQWYRVKLTWSNQTYNVFVNDQQLNTSPLPFVYQNNSGPLSMLQLDTSWGQASTGVFDIDNVTYPGCGESLGLTVKPTTGVAPLEVTATALLPAKNLLREAASEVSDVDAGTGQKLTTTQGDDGVITVTDVPLSTAPGGTLPNPLGSTKCWLYDLDQNKVNQLQWKQTVPDRAMVTARLSWQIAQAQGDRGSTMLGGIGLIDGSGFLHNWVGFLEGNQGTNGLLAAATRDYQTINVVCNGISARDTKGEWVAASPTQDWAAMATTGSKHLSSGTGSATVKILRDGTHIKLYVDNKLVKEGDMQGSVAGIAFATSGLPGYPYGTLKLESLKLEDAGLTWNFGDGTAALSTTETEVKHTYAKAGSYDLSLVVGPDTAKQPVLVTTFTSQGSGGNAPGGTNTSSGSGTSGNGPAEAAKKAVAALVASGGSLTVNLGIAAILALGTTYLMLRRKIA